jgi:signal transduction histidine kinase
MRVLKSDRGSPGAGVDGSLLRSLEQDRAAVAEALRAETAQVLATVLIGLAAVETSDDLDEVRAGLREMREAVRLDLQRVQVLATRIQPSVLDDMGIPVALEGVARGLAQPGGPAIHVEFAANSVELPDSDRALVFRILEEAMRNAAAHAGAQQIAVTTSGTDYAMGFQVRDDGSGFDVPAAFIAGTGLGLMRARARALGGTLDVSSRRGAGTRVLLRLPRGKVSK